MTPRPPFTYTPALASEQTLLQPNRVGAGRSKIGVQATPSWEGGLKHTVVRLLSRRGVATRFPSLARLGGCWHCWERSRPELRPFPVWGSESAETDAKVSRSSFKPQPQG